MNYLDSLPVEILYEIYVYIKVTIVPMALGSDVQTQNIHEKLLNDKLFWIIKLNYEKLSDYIKYLGFTNSFIKDYELINRTNEYICEHIINKNGNLFFENDTTPNFLSLLINRNLLTNEIRELKNLVIPNLLRSRGVLINDITNSNIIHSIYIYYIYDKYWFSSSIRPYLEYPEQTYHTKRIEIQKEELKKLIINLFEMNIDLIEITDYIPELEEAK